MATKRESGSKKPVTGRPASKKPATKKSPTRKSATKKSATKKSATKKSATKKSLTRKSAARKSAATGPAARRPTGPGAIRRASGKALRLAGVGTDAVTKATGRAWDQWLAVLDRAGALTMPHKAIAALLASRYRVPAWWSQMVTVGYEQARGLRKPHQKPDGYSVSVLRTVAATVERLHGAWEDPKLRAIWLGRAPLAARRDTGGKSMRMTWTAGNSGVEVDFFPASAGRSRVQVRHDKLANGRAREKQKTYWSDALDRLKAMLEKAA